MKLSIYADGACEGNQFATNVGGWGVIIPIQPHNVMLSGAERNTTNNKMELMACIKAIEYAQQHQLCNNEIIIHTDSEYTVKGMNEWRFGWEKKGWRNSQGQPVKNRELWQQLIRLNHQCPATFLHVRGHAGDRYNEQVDRLAVQAIANLKKRS